MSAPEGAVVLRRLGAEGPPVTVGEVGADRLVVAVVDFGQCQLDFRSSWACQSQCLGLACPCTPACLKWRSLMHL